MKKNMVIFFGRMKSKGKSPARKPIKKIAWSWIGSFIGIGLIASLGSLFPNLIFNNTFLIGSFGASAVLVYGAPLAEFSQPRNLIGGHFISALVGVTVFFIIGQKPEIASALSVSIAIVLMHFTRTLHPPGGATALIAVIGDNRVHALGYKYVISPILIEALIILIVGLFVNNMSKNPKRHYPVYWV